MVNINQENENIETGSIETGSPESGSIDTGNVEVGPLGATAYTHPCELYGYHAPRPSRTQGHHRHPRFLQDRVYGELRDNEVLWVCGTCHDNIHEWLFFLLGEEREPNPHPGRKAQAEAQKSYDWYKSVEVNNVGNTKNIGNTENGGS